MSLVKEFDFALNDLIGSQTSSGSSAIQMTSHSFGSIDTLKYYSTVNNSSEKTFTYYLNSEKLDDYIFSSNDMITLSFNVYLNIFNDSNDIFKIKINDNVIFYFSGGTQVSNKKFTINYLFKSDDLTSILSGTNPSLNLIFDGIDNQTDEYVLLDKNFELYAIYKPEFSDTTNIPRTITNLTLNTSFNASSETIANENACEIKGQTGGTSSGNVTFNLSNKLLNGKPVSLFFNLNIDQFENGEKLNIQIDNGSGTYVDYFEIVGIINTPPNDSDTNNKLKTFFYSQTENYNSSNSFYIKFELSVDSGTGIDPNDHVYFDDMFTYVPEAINFFDASGINPSGTITLEPNLLINSNEYVGSIELFNSLPLPDNYLLCDGSEITKSDNNGNYYAPLIDFLNNNTTGNSCYLPDFTSRHPLGVNSGISNYNTDSINHIGENQLDINYFPSHSHNSNTISVTMDNYSITVNKTGAPPPGSQQQINQYITIQNNTETYDIDYGVEARKSQHGDRNIAGGLGPHSHQIPNDVHGSRVQQHRVETTYNKSYELTSQTNQTINEKTSGNDLYQLELISYQLYFGIRFK